MQQTLNAKMTNNIRNIVLLCSAAALLSASALAQENGFATAGDFGRPPEPGQTVWQAGVNSGYDAGSSAKFDGTRKGDSDAYNLRLQAGTLISLNEDWFLTLGVY